jgi:hypothetical protein
MSNPRLPQALEWNADECRLPRHLPSLHPTPPFLEVTAWYDVERFILWALG